MNRKPLEGLVCPITKQPLYRLDEHHVATADQSHVYLVENGIFRLKSSQHHYRIVIPSRLASTRLPNKPLAKIDEWNLINTVVYSALQTGLDVIVATDSDLIEQAVNEFTAQHQLGDRVQVVLTDSSLENGTERIAQAIDKLELSDDEIIVNVQGDEPFFNPEILNDLVAHFVEAETKNPSIKMATIGQLAHPEDVTSPNAVKVVTDKYGLALYFSRNPIPYPRSVAQEQIKYIKHAGVYVYRAKFVREYKALAMTPLATAESLEQLKVLEHGYKIALMMIQGRGFVGVDTAQDLEQAQKIKAQYWQTAPGSPQAPDQESYRKFLASFGSKYLD
ncbi:3-deoxy-manno-octulosonate cytidylyltransferase [Psittacicella melopsittaci]|uniref:3-deoxy-manno-octulosonate cytidylyltransferase n=1 Tax=Psittacicella melopsittaci TaxID=2028576 RepID=A0A3A1Y7I4_9GAMM|nr:3-deoxy-manno-octulosonate cytidylyltransferase [Psittacicella melopsittaci]RIY33575.1 3-deoxy-manno-octulosonate cytidylyltransferase [Psittacicella melopsittaci]